MAEIINGIEIPEELLESIAGGVLDDDSRNNIEAFVTAFKQLGMNLDEIFDQFAFARYSSDADEIFAYIEQVYGKRIL